MNRQNAGEYFFNLGLSKGRKSVKQSPFSLSGHSHEAVSRQVQAFITVVKKGGSWGENLHLWLYSGDGQMEGWD